MILNKICNALILKIIVNSPHTSFIHSVQVMKNNSLSISVTKFAYFNSIQQLYYRPYKQKEREKKRDKTQEKAHHQDTAISQDYVYTV